jgi:hypothetical protein
VFQATESERSVEFSGSTLPNSVLLYDVIITYIYLLFAGDFFVSIKIYIRDAIYIYIYIYMCVCVCVSYYSRDAMLTMHSPVADAVV